MNNDIDERTGGTKTVVIVILVVAIIITILWATGLIRWEDSSKEQKREIATIKDNYVSTSEGQFVISEEE